MLLVNTRSHFPFAGCATFLLPRGQSLVGQRIDPLHGHVIQAQALIEATLSDHANPGLQVPRQVEPWNGLDVVRDLAGFVLQDEC